MCGSEIVWLSISNKLVPLRENTYIYVRTTLPAIDSPEFLSGVYLQRGTKCRQLIQLFEP
jgi:hypothetical protein